MLFECWEADNSSIVFGTRKSNAKNLPKDQRVRLIHSVDLPTWEEAMAVHFIRMGWDPYKPEGRPIECPACGAMYYPRSSGDCWKCVQVAEGNKLVDVPMDVYEDMVEALSSSGGSVDSLLEEY